MYVAFSVHTSTHWIELTLRMLFAEDFSDDTGNGQFGDKIKIRTAVFNNIVYFYHLSSNGYKGVLTAK